MSRSRIEERAKDAVARCLRKQLILPNLYFDAEWPEGGGHVDILAIDRNGVGDVHVIEIRQDMTEVLVAIEGLKLVPSHYRWVVIFPRKLPDSYVRAIYDSEVVYPAEGMGRVGVIEVHPGPGDELKAEVRLSAERFKGSYYKMADQFSAKHEPDVQYRDEVTPAT